MLEAHARAQVGPEVEVRAITARFGAPYIACEASYAVAAHATLDAWATDRARYTDSPDSVLIGCFGDPGLQALQETSAAAVTGLAQAAFAQAGQYGRFAVVTGGVRWRPILERHAQALGLREQLVGIHTIEPTGALLAQDPVGARALIAKACRDAQRLYQVDAVIVGGAGLAGIAMAVQSSVDVPLIDSVSAGVTYALTGALRSPRGRDCVGFTWSGVSAELSGTTHCVHF